VLSVDNAPERIYKRRVDETKTTVHWGQRKLLLSEIEFLTLVGSVRLKGATVVYAGAAPGTHIKYLSSLYPYVNFVLVDPAPFTVKASKTVIIRRELFTDELAMEMRGLYGPNVFFISDIRTADPDRDSLDQSESKIKWDMAAQMRWHLMLGSERSMLKFRLPWDQSHSEYLDGDVYLPVWGPQTTTESRLITSHGKPAAVKKYDHQKYERQMFYFNCMTRVSLYKHDVTAPGLDHCYDCAAEAHILEAFIRMREPDLPQPRVSEMAGQMSRSISEQLSRRRTLCDPTPDKAERKAVIRKRQYCDEGQTPAHETAERCRRAKYDVVSSDSLLGAAMTIYEEDNNADDDDDDDDVVLVVGTSVATPSGVRRSRVSFTDSPPRVIGHSVAEGRDAADAIMLVDLSPPHKRNRPKSG
jgi:hypothetical protein